MSTSSKLTFPGSLYNILKLNRRVIQQKVSNKPELFPRYFTQFSNYLSQCEEPNYEVYLLLELFKAENEERVRKEEERKRKLQEKREKKEKENETENNENEKVEKTEMNTENEEAKQDKEEAELKTEEVVDAAEKIEKSEMKEEMKELKEETKEKKVIISSTANLILLLIGMVKTNPKKYATLKDISFTKSFRLPMFPQFKELDRKIVDLNVFEQADEKHNKFYETFMGNDVEKLIESYKEIMLLNERCSTPSFVECIIVRAFEMMAGNSLTSLSFDYLKKLFDFTNWFTVELTLLKRAQIHEFEVTIDPINQSITLKKYFTKKMEKITLSEKQFREEKEEILKKTRMFNAKIRNKEQKEIERKLEEERRRKEEEEDERIRKEEEERKRKEEEEEKERKKEEMRKMKQDQQIKMQKLYKMQEKVRMKEEKDKQIKDLFEKYYYGERARRIVESGVNEQRGREEEEEIKRIYKEVCESKERMHKQEHERKIMLKKKFTNLNSLQTWLETIGKGESEEEKQARIEEERRKAEEERKRIEEEERKKREEEERKRRIEEEERRKEMEKKKEEERKRREDELFRQNQARIEREKEQREKATDVYRPSFTSKGNEDEDGWNTVRKGQKAEKAPPKQSGIPTFSSKPAASFSSKGGRRDERRDDSYRPPRRDDRRDDDYRPPRRDDRRDDRREDSYRPPRRDDDRAPPKPAGTQASFSSKSSASFSSKPSGGRRGGKR